MFSISFSGGGGGGGGGGGSVKKQHEFLFASLENVGLPDWIYTVQGKNFLLDLYSERRQ